MNEEVLNTTTTQGEGYMKTAITHSKINKSNIPRLTPEKKKLFKSLQGSASSKNIDLNKIREDQKYGKD